MKSFPKLFFRLFVRLLGSLNDLDQIVCKHTLGLFQLMNPEPRVEAVRALGMCCEITDLAHGGVVRHAAAYARATDSCGAGYGLAGL